MSTPELCRGNRQGDFATASLGTCNISIPVGHPQRECHKTSSLSRKHLYKENIGKHHLLNLDNTLAKTSEICSVQEGVAVKPLIQLPPTSHIYIPRSKPTEACLCKGAFGLQKICQIVDGAEGVRMLGAQLTFSPCQGRAIELLCLQGGLWMDDSRVASYAVAR